MSWRSRRTAVLVLALAAAFYATFMFAKHDPALRGVIPVGVDPYDAVGSFGVGVGVIVARRWRGTPRGGTRPRAWS